MDPPYTNVQTDKSLNFLESIWQVCFSYLLPVYTWRVKYVCSDIFTAWTCWVCMVGHSEYQVFLNCMKVCHSTNVQIPAWDSGFIAAPSCHCSYTHYPTLGIHQYCLLHMGLYNLELSRLQVEHLSPSLESDQLLWVINALQWWE